MKALSLHQPWASLMAIGAKVNETRSRAWDYKGDVAIHAAKLFWKNGAPDYAIPALTQLWLHRHKFPGTHRDVEALYKSLPFGAVVCVVEKTGCISTNDDNGEDRSLTALEVKLGDYSANRFYYPTRNLRRLKVPVIVSGSQGVWELPSHIENLVQDQALNQLTS